MENVEQKVPAIVTGLMVVALAALTGTTAWFALAPTPPPAPANRPSPRPAAPGPHADPAAWIALRNPDGSSSAVAPGAAARRFRLAGTFFTFDDTGAELRKAILDDRERHAQAIVGQGGNLEDYKVTEVGSNHVTLVRAGERTTLRMGFDFAPARAASGGTNGPVGNLATAEETVLENTPFGQRVGERRWVLSRERLMEYYQELVEQPERVAALYTSLKPDYKENEISGYRLNQEGENDFFKAVGFQEGDVVRKVNSMNMTSQARAEYFLGEFVTSRLNAVVIDIERNGEPTKLSYLIR